MFSHTALFEQDSINETMFWSFAEVPTPYKQKSPTITPPHYGDGIEFVLTDGIDGVAVIDGTRYEMHKKSAFYVAPNQIHSFTYMYGNGSILCFKLDINRLKRFLDLQQLLLNEYKDLSLINNNCENYDFIYDNLNELRSNPQTFNAVRCILNIFEKLSKESTHQIMLKESLNSNFLQNVIEYTTNNYKTTSTAEIAKKLGYNPNYFCSKFKTLSGGITYIDYLNTQKLSVACQLITAGESITNACFDSGFQSVPYFIKVFKKALGLSPLQYKNLKNKEMTSN